MISKRAKELTSNPSAIMTGHMACSRDPYSESNPQGYLNFGIAENRLIDDLALKVLSRPCAPSPSHVHYAPLYGLPELREAFAAFAQKFLSAGELNPEQVVVQTGLSAMCESMAFALFERGDEIIVPAPYYTGFKFDFDGRFGVKLAPAQMSGFKHSIADIEKAWTPNTKGLLLTSPHNPTGEVLGEEFLKDALAFCKKHNLHLISDEIYALSRLDRREHKSALNIDPGFKNIHFLYGMAKDFGLAGIKTGFYYSPNQECVQAMQAASYFHPVATHTQALVADFLSDHRAVEAFVNESNQRVSKALESLEKLLPRLKFNRPKAGMFLTADFSELLNNFKSEEDLFNYFLEELKVNMTPGKEMGLASPGFFRICYARPKAQIKEFAKRLSEFL